MICDDVAYREDYVDYLIEYNGETETVLDIYKDTGCVNFIDERFAVLYRPKPDDYMVSQVIRIDGYQQRRGCWSSECTAGEYFGIDR